METLLSMVIRDKQVDNHKLFVGQEDVKRITRDIRYELADIVVRLNRVERFMFSDSGTKLNDHQENDTVINAPPLNIVPPLNTPDANSPPLSSIIILD